LAMLKAASLSLSLSAQCLNTESIVKDVLCHICVHTLTRLAECVHTDMT
jgi:hypothetical protein